MADERDLRAVRRDYDTAELKREHLPEDPLVLFGGWLAAAEEVGLKDATAMALATVAADGTPTVRIVLLKHFDADGFCWYTDYRSRKGRDLAANPSASAAFYWRDFDRQVRITGSVAKVDRADSIAYFESRPLESRLSAAISEQSAVVDSRDTLLERVRALREAFPDGDVPAPETWGGYRLAPEQIEFWQGREGRLHDRFVYSRLDDGWRIERLQP